MNKNLYTFINNNIFRYRSKCRKIDKKNRNLIGLVNDHHIIPKSLKNHRLLKETKFKVNQNYNLFIMPNSISSSEKLKLKNNLIHNNNHIKYNKYVKKNLDFINNYKTFEEKNYYLWLFLCFLKKNLKNNQDNIPWN